jgi:hypothetical protein
MSKMEENEEITRRKKEEYPKGAIWTDGDVLDEVVIKEFDIVEDLKERNISVYAEDEVEGQKIVDTFTYSEVFKKEEDFSIRKTFTMRKSTARLLVRLKLVHPNVNIRANTIIDRAIRYYYKHIIEDGASQEEEI